MREAYLEKLETQLKDWEAKAGDKLGLRTRMEDARRKLEELRAETGDRWDVMRMGVESAWEEIKTAFETAMSDDIGAREGDDTAKDAKSGGESAA
jgi:N12 class adenine-specific DNA methylase